MDTPVRKKGCWKEGAVAGSQGAIVRGAAKRLERPGHQMP